MEVEIIADGCSCGLFLITILFDLLSITGSRTILIGLKIIGLIIDIIAIGIASKNSVRGVLVALLLISTAPMILYLIVRLCNISKNINKKNTENNNIYELIVKPPDNYYKYVRSIASKAEKIENYGDEENNMNAPEVAIANSNANANGKQLQIQPQPSEPTPQSIQTNQTNQPRQQQQQQPNNNKISNFNKKYSNYNINTQWYGSLFRFEDWWIKFTAYLFYENFNNINKPCVHMSIYDWMEYFNSTEIEWHGFGCYYYMATVMVGIFEFAVVGLFLALALQNYDDSDTVEKIMVTFSFGTTLFGNIQRVLGIIAMLCKKKSCVTYMCAVFYFGLIVFYIMVGNAGVRNVWDV